MITIVPYQKRGWYEFNTEKTSYNNFQHIVKLLPLISDYSECHVYKI